MSDQQNSTNIPDDELKKEGHSLLSDILKASASKEPSHMGGPNLPKKEEVEKKIYKKEPISFGVFVRLIASLLFVSIIFFGSFLAYIAFNPDQAVFFTRTFNIDPNDVQNLLKKLINGSFGFVMIVVSILWIITLFRAFWVPKELKRKRLLSWLVASLIGIILFLVLTFWGYLFRVVGATDYSNPSGTILIYDQALMVSNDYKDNARIYDTANLIGPIEIFFDIRGNAELISKNNLYTIDAFDINFDDARCNNGTSRVSGANPEREQSIVCIFDEIKVYNLVGNYSVRTREGQSLDIPIILPSIEIRGLVDIKNQENNRGDKIVTLDATALQRIGSPRWVYQNGSETTDPAITETVTSIPQGICLKLFETNGCDRLFVLEDRTNKVIEGSITTIRDQTDRNSFRFSLSGITINQNEIVNIEWLVDGQNIVCQGSSEICNYRSNTFGRKKIKATVELANGKEYNFETEIVINEPINIIRNIKVLNTDGVLLNERNTYDSDIRAFILKNTIIPPETLIFDARDVISGNPGYSLGSVLWKISNGKNVEERRGEKISIDFNQPLRYTIDIIYTFSREVPGEKAIEDTIRETVIVDIERRSLMPRMNISTTSDYVPALVTIDASQSESENGEIKKFIFDFGEGKPFAEGDSIQQYSYTNPGEKVITLTIVAENGEKASLKKTLVLKDEIKTVDFAPSISPGIVGNVVDFEALGTSGQIEEYIWNFGDNTPVSREYMTTHTYTTPGIYTVVLTVRYTDGTQQSKKKTYEVTE